MYKPVRKAMATLFLLAFAAPIAAEVTITQDYPGANILVDRQTGQDVYLRQDLRDTKGWWFYWNFTASATPGTEATFHFIDGNVVGTRGPAISTDGGMTWRWLGTESVQSEKKRVAFTYRFTEDATAVRFAFAPPYQAAGLARFLEKHTANPHLRVEPLCTTEGGRAAHRLHLGRLETQPAYRILLTARHHACESMASYVLEGLMEAILNRESGAWFRENVETLVIPFVDLDGVENGDQGKNRQPRDHGRDYQGESIYNSTRAIRDYVPDWSAGRLRLTLDLHCPHIRGANNESIYQVGHPDPAIWREQQRFAELLAARPDLPLPYDKKNDLAFGVAWNKASNYTAGAGIFHWTGSLEGVRMASALEIPYANAGETTVTPERARAFGAAMLPALQAWLESTAP